MSLNNFYKAMDKAIEIQDSSVYQQNGQYSNVSNDQNQSHIDDFNNGLSKMYNSTPIIKKP